MITTSKKKTRILELDALRGIAALLVVLFHLTMNQPMNSYFAFGKTGVDLFFIISGFVIFNSIRNTKSSWSFLWNRFIRLYPAYWTVVLLTGFLIWINNFITSPEILFPTKQLLANLTMFQYYFGIPNIDGPYWTLIIELNFYLLTFLMLVVKKGRFIVHTCFLLMLITGFFFFFEWDEVYAQSRQILPILMYTPLFLAGILFQKLKTGSGSKWGNYSLIITCLLFKCFFLKIDYSQGDSFLTFTEHAITTIIYFFLFFMLIKGWLKILVNKTTLFFGKISYSLYLTHQYLAFSFLIPLLTTKYHVPFSIAAFLIALPITISIATLITYCIEYPAMKALKRFSRK